MKIKFSRSFSILLVVLLSFSSLAVLNVKAQDFERIYIKADGTIKGTNKIQQIGNTYHFSNDINGSLVIRRDNIIIDGNNYRLQSLSLSGIYLSERENVTIKNLQITTQSYGIEVSSSSHNNIESNDVISNSKDGIFLKDSSYNNIESNNISNNGNGIVIGSSSNYNNIIGNNIENNGFGINLWDSSNNKISANKIASNRYGGLYLTSSSNNTINDNNITNQVESIRLGSISKFNNFIGNNFTNTDFCIDLDSSATNNIIYHNNFGANIRQVACYSTFNVWDDGSIGNYWIDYDGLDINGDGIGDTSYIINENNQDNYPLINLVNSNSNPTPSAEPTPTSYPKYPMEDSEPFPTTLAVASIGIIAVIGIGILVYFKKHRK